MDATSARIAVVDPASDEVIDHIDVSTVAEVGAAVAAAAAAAPGWARTAPAGRAAAVKAGARALAAAVEELAELQTREGGKPIADSRGGVEAGVGALEQYAELGPLHRGRSLQGGWGATDVMVHEPYGVVAVLVPWNDPVAIACGLIGAALVAGNTVVFKPSEKTPLSGARLAQLLGAALPAGVLQLVQGDERVGRPLVADERVDVVLHVGSVGTGQEIASVCAAGLRKAVVELGGKDPMVVDEDVDPVWAAGQAALGSWANAGQICTSVERIYVHRAVAGPFVDELVRLALAKARRVGPGLDPATEMGPLIDDDLRRRVHAHVEGAVAAGASILAGGEVAGGPGSFYPPTVVVEVPSDTALFTEETFGPVAAVQVVDSFEEALARAGSGAYGLAATVLTASQTHAAEAARSLDVGTVKINAVFGGAPGGAAEPGRGSGLGFGYGPELLDELTRTKVIHAEPVP